MARWGKQIVFLLSSMTLLTACTDKQETEVEILRPVRFQQVSNLQADMSQKFTGVVNADTETDFSFKVGGTLVSIGVKPGAKVKKGDLIAALDSSDTKLKYDKQLLVLKKSQAQMETASSGLHRTKGLYENNNVPLSEYESAKEKYSNALASYETEKRALELVKRELGYYKLYSPDDGIVLSSDVSKNENIQAGQVVAIIQTGDALTVKLGLPEQYIALAKIDQMAKIDISSIPGKIFTGKVTEVAYAVNQDSSTYPITVKILDATNAIRPGMPATVLLNFDTLNNQSGLFIPVHSVAKDEMGNYVLLVEKEGDGNGVVRRRAVTVGRMTTGGFEVLEGLKAGDKVITAGISSLADGMKVRLLQQEK